MNLAFLKLSIFLASFGLSLSAAAHPVTYEGGLMVKSMFRDDMSENSVTYSFHRRWAAGLEVDRLMLPGKDTTWALTELNALAYRWNGEHAQGNVYLLSGVGGYFEASEQEWAGKAGIQVDYETRRFYTLAQYTNWFAENVDTQMAVYRIGMAPYLAGYNELNIWGILQVDYNRDMRKYVQVTPMLRFFYKNVLWEIGASTRGNIYGQFMLHL